MPEKMRKRKARQLTLFPERPRRGRPPKPHKDYVPHVKRPPLDKDHAAHITLKLLPRVGTLRTGRLHRIVRAAFVAGCDRFGFRPLPPPPPPAPNPPHPRGRRG